MSYSIIEQLKIIGMTSLVVDYGEESTGKITRDGVSEFLCDGIIELNNTLIGSKRIRTMSIRKLRNTNHSQHIHNLDITDKGMVVEAAEEVYK